MSLHCPDGRVGIFPPPAPLVPRERGAPWRPPGVTLCERCGFASWQHRSDPPVIRDELDRAIYATAFVEAFRSVLDDQPVSTRAASAIREAEFVVEMHRRARSGA